MVFGESRNDIDSITHLLIHANASLAGHIFPSLEPVTLQRTAQKNSVDRWVRRIGEVVAASERRGQPVRAVVVHRDADGPDPHGREAQRMTDQLASVRGHPVVPVQMIEAWWFLFPEALAAVRPRAWRTVLARSERDVETISDPKQELRRLTRRTRQEYAEADSPAIARAIRDNALTKQGRSASFDRMVDLARRL